MGRIAVIGSGISGLACAEMLRGPHDVVVFETADRAGGHSRTVMAGGVPVDTGFIVYNEVNYPLLTAFLRYLGVETERSDMSFGVSLGGGDIEFSATSVRGLFAQPWNALSPAHWSMLCDAVRFFRNAPSVLTAANDPTLGEFLDTLKLGEPFRQRFLIPMGSAIWSTPPNEMLTFPAKTFVRFFQNHGLLTIADQHPWRTIKGGSRVYVKKMMDRLGNALRLSTPVIRLSTETNKVKIWTAHGSPEEFDAVILSCHADQAMQLLSDATANERSILGAFTFRDNEAVLHRDMSFMPKAKSAWASWIFSSDAATTGEQLSVTYWMTRLQNLASPDVFVTLNPVREIAANLVLDRHVFRHPVFSCEAVSAQDQLSHIQGQRGIWYCGAWTRYGFHEDGIWSAERVASALGGGIPWA
jgi:predicted NAD/FAD-binding protein